VIEQLAAHTGLNLLQLYRRELGQQATGVRGTLAVIPSHAEPTLQMGCRDTTLFYLSIRL
jgi:hypothetical protein